MKKLIFKMKSGDEYVTLIEEEAEALATKLSDYLDEFISINYAPCQSGNIYNWSDTRIAILSVNEIESVKEML